MTNNRYLITISAVVEAEDKQDAEQVAQQIVNADLDEDTQKQLENLHYHDGWGNPEIERISE